MAQRKYMVIINPKSGTGHHWGLERKIRTCLESLDAEHDIRYSEYAGHCHELAREAVRRHYYAVLAVGGDGTVNEIAGALRGSDVILGIVPRGSGNGLARHLDESIDIDKALRIIAADHPAGCDYGTANGRPFFCTFGLGFDAAVSHDFAHMHRRGLMSYVRSALHKYVHYAPREYEISFDGHTVRVKAFLIAVCNASQYGNNAYIAPDASIRDGLLDLVIIHGGNPLTRALVGVDLLTGYLKRNVLVQTIHVRSAIIRQDPGPGHLDGEPADMPRTIKVKCHHERLHIFTDPAKSQFKPLVTPIRSMHYDLWYRIRNYFGYIFKK